MSRLLSIYQLSITFYQQICLEDFSAQVGPGERIALIGPNGSGKTVLLETLAGTREGDGRVELQGTAALARQLSEGEGSGGERTRASLEAVFAQEPDLLFLDEPTNHLDSKNREWLFGMLNRWDRAAIVATHDADLLHRWPNTIWYLNDGTIDIFHGSYSSFLEERRIAEEQAREEFASLRKKRRVIASKLQKEETRKARTRRQGRKKYDNDPMLRKGSCERAEKTQGHGCKRRVREEREEVAERLAELRRSPRPAPRFHLSGTDRTGVEVRDGSIGFEAPLLRDLNLTVEPGGRLALRGRNGSGKTTLLRALLDDPAVAREGSWRLPTSVGYLDQHYDILNGAPNVREAIRQQQPSWTAEEIARHLNAFLFCHHATHEKPIEALSGGERCRLALAMLAARTPDLLLVDEVTNNLDIETKEHVAEVLRAYPGTLIISCHEESFLQDAQIVDHLALDHIGHQP